ncbi:hypothetical protein [Mycolicibacterium fallax]|uniref:Transmembrane protein n=1 Tax=Mycolicibacterium fallax TaxID=1793 RepID=A0A1X1RFF3_MYCFA|nr:hypothetical protein [Mycolicibacterium fallax]ORV04292.1 hypothetical protein AWC04_09085 [Mycolicibacterium fallax]HOW95379.1 hypothetical protein [Mycolicibacterium fallax]HSA40778.1 hypothetical protein [Mycobacterium sp.]
MPDKPEPSTGDNLGRIDDDVRASFRFAVIATAAAGLVLLITSFWLRGCGPMTDVSTAACGRPERISLAVLSPLVLFGTACYAFVKTIRVWRVRRTWWGWQGVGWFLLTLMVLVLTTFLPALAGSGLSAG